MRIIFSRKGFDSAAGGAPSPIVNGQPISLPIPTGKMPSETTYGLLGLGEIVARMTNGTKRRLGPDDPCHEDPMFYGDRCAFGQNGAAQGHLTKQSVGVGDVFLFFGLFAEEDGRDRHHRIFGYLRVEECRVRPHERDQPEGLPRQHPHTIPHTIWNKNNTIYIGRGGKARNAHQDLRLSKPGGPISRWLVPPWLRETPLSYHQKLTRWTGTNELQVVGRGQEFVADIDDLREPKAWLATIIDFIHN